MNILILLTNKFKKHLVKKYRDINNDNPPLNNSN